MQSIAMLQKLHRNQKQKPYPEWFLCQCKSYPVECEQGICCWTILFFQVGTLYGSHFVSFALVTG